MTANDGNIRPVTFAIIQGDKIAIEFPLSNWSSFEKIERTIDCIRGGIQMAVVDLAHEERADRLAASLSDARAATPFNKYPHDTLNEIVTG